MSLSSSQPDLNTSPAWRCSHNNRLHRHDSSCTADTPPMDVLPDTPGRLHRMQQKNTAGGLGSSQASQPTPTKPQQSTARSKTARIDRTLSPAVEPTSPGLLITDDEDVPPPPASPYIATTDQDIPRPGHEVSSQEEPVLFLSSSPPMVGQATQQPKFDDVPAAHLPSSPPLLNPRNLQPTVEDSPESPPLPQRSTFFGLLDRFTRSPTPTPAPQDLPSSPPAAAPSSPCPTLAAQRQVNTILLTRLSDQSAQLSRLQTRNQVLSAANQTQVNQLQLVTKERDGARAEAEIERARGQVLTAGWVSTVIAGGLYLCWRWVSGVEFEYIERRRREGLGM